MRFKEFWNKNKKDNWFILGIFHGIEMILLIGIFLIVLIK